jgi:hypothetical protein
MRVALILALTTLSACTGLPKRASHEILDVQTGNTLTVVAKPLVFARARTDVAANDCLPQQIKPDRANA